ncbi:MAG TPA: 6,7-dimethyl-8-ribityllumazine synthase [Candidatus Sulfotelmatobacter sp.]|jgi:6,7-dimethyl-8-ribityllumazine synthase|nr:6,7-dimethyl-8-ribityllumazine synthase [Candidatus Sulfotelmatobacter sp.]
MLKKQASQNFNILFPEKLKIAIVRTNYYVDLIDNLEIYARKTLFTAGISETNIETFTAPGSWEVPLLVQAVAESKKFDAIIAFGIIIKGETYHFDMIANEVAQALMQISLDYSIPVGFEVLAVFDKKHAEIRAEKNEHNKGIEAANAVLQTIQSLKKISK